MHKAAGGKDKRATYQMAVQKQESVLWDETDSESGESRISYVGKPTTMEAQNQYLPKEGEQDNEEDLAQAQSRPVDRGFRAFSHSIHAT